VTDSAHVQTKIAVPLAESRNLSLVTIRNPTSEPISNYKTAIDPALIAGKILPVDQRILELSGEPVPAWQSNYGTGLSKAEIFHKSSILSNGIQQVFVGDGPWVKDLGPVVDIPQPPDDDVPELIDIWDNWHKDVVTDLSSCDVLMFADMTYPSVPYFTDYLAAYRVQSSLFPLSSRHVVKTSDGVLHAVVAYAISGLSRIVYMKSENGGETWSSTIVDNNDGHHYVTPSITCDKNDGIHITYTRWDSAAVSTFWLFSGSSIPSGFTLVSGSGDFGYHRLLGGEEGSYYPALGNNPDDYNDHCHYIHVSSGSVDTTTNPLMLAEPVSTFPAVNIGFHHTAAEWSSPVLQSLLPPSRSLKLLRYYGIPPSLPADIVVPFDTSVPSGFTRYSAQDGYCVYCSDDVGTILGLDQHRHQRTLTVSGVTNVYNVEYYPFEVPTIYNHTHTCDAISGYTAVNPYRQQVVFGKVDSSITTIPAHSLLMFLSDDASIPDTTLLSGVGGALNKRYLVGGSSYADLGGALEHTHPDYNGGTFGPTPVGPQSRTAAGPLTFSRSDHSHIIHAWWDDASNYGSRIMPCIYHVDSSINMSTYGNDLFYRYISPAGTPSTPINISELHTYFPSFEGVCLADGSDNLHFCWSAQGLNTNPDRARISYRKMTSGSLGARTDLTTSDQHMLYPSIDIDKNDVIHVAWFNATTMASIEYRQFASGSWSVIETVDNSNYVGYPSNIVADENGDVLITYLKWSDNVTPIQDVMYRRRAAGSWGTSYNLSPGKAAGGHHQFTSQIYIDNKKNIIVMWNGKGYGSHTGVYHPVYRIILPDDTVYPPLTGDATDLFPDDDNPIIYPVVFWHSFPLSDSVYQNLVSSGFTFVYLYNPRGTYGETADLRFFSSPSAMVGDVGSIGGGGIGSDDHFPGGVGGEGVFEQESYSISVRGYICKSYSTSQVGRYLG
jgi:hypothetical protein